MSRRQFSRSAMRWVFATSRWIRPTRRSSSAFPLPTITLASPTCALFAAVRCTTPGSQQRTNSCSTWSKANSIRLTSRLHLRDVEKLRRPFRRWMVVLASGTLSAAVTLELGGEPLTAVAAFIVATITGYVGVWMATHKAPAFFINLVLALMATLAAVGISQTDVKVKASLVVVGGIIMLLPGMSLVVAAQEAIGSFSLTAAARIVELTVSTIGIVAGVLFGLVAADRFDVQMQVIVRSDSNAAIITVALVAAGCASISAAVTYQSPRKLALMCGLVAAIGYAIHIGLEQQALFGTPGAAAAIPAVAIGFASKLMGARLRVPTVLVTVPAIVPLLPGLAVYQGLLALTQSHPFEGIGYLVNAVSIAIALAGGVLLGQLIGGRPSQYVSRHPSGRR